MGQNESVSDQIIDISDEAFEELQASLDRVEAMKQDVAEGLFKAKQKSLDEHVEKFRAILRQLVIMENALLEEKSKKESAKLAIELERLEEEYNHKLSMNSEKTAARVAQSKYTRTAARYGIAASLVGFVGVFACLMGCIAYLILVQIDSLHLPFEWIWILVNAVGAVLFAAAGFSLNQKSFYYDDLAKEELLTFKAEEERAAKKLAAEYSNVTAQAYAVEMEMEMQAQKESEEELVSEGDAFLSVKKVKVGTTESLHVDVKDHPALVVTAALAGAAAMVAAFWMGKRSYDEKLAKKEKKEERKANKRAKKQSKKASKKSKKN